MSIQQVNEQSALFLRFSFFDEADSPIEPATIEWRVDDITNGVEVVDWTSIVTPNEVVVVSVSGQTNLIADQSHTFELRRVTVRIDDGLATESSQEKYYRLKNLGGVI